MVVAGSGVLLISTDWKARVAIDDASFSFARLRDVLLTAARFELTSLLGALERIPRECAVSNFRACGVLFELDDQELPAMAR
jgi:hypothetical protein